jgi:hypothetical protein
MIPLVAGALLSAAPEVARGITGIVQAQKANQAAKKLERPTMQIPESIMDYVNIAKGLTSTGLPGKEAIAGDIERSTANALRAGKEYGASTDVAAVYANEQQQKRTLGVQDAAMNLENIDAYQNALKSKAMYEQQVFDYNEAQPYAEAVSAISAQKNAANTNMFESVKNLSGIGASMLNPALKTEGAIPVTGATTENAAVATEGVAMAPGNETFADKHTRLGRTVVQEWPGDTKATMEEFSKLLISNPEKARQIAAQLGL